MRILASLFLFLGVHSALAGGPVEATQVKDWTMLVFINGNNNLDPFGEMNIKQMEEVGSTANLNIVVQWASYKARTTKRLLVQRSTNPSTVTSPIVENMGKVDMGDYKELVKFIKWGATNYPARHYMISVWNHGSGWHFRRAPTREISYDDFSGNHITTEQLGIAMNESSKFIGQKIDIYGSDACLMAMPEVAGEMKDSVEYFAGSEELEPGAGWPYNDFLKAWQANPGMDAKSVAQTLSDTYLKAYSGGSLGTDQVTFSIFDLNQWAPFTKAVGGLVKEYTKVSATDLSTLKRHGKATQKFTNSDYRDMGDFMDRIQGQTSAAPQALLAAQAAYRSFVVHNSVSPGYNKATGLSIWLPLSTSEYNAYATRYQNLTFAKDTGWAQLVSLIASAR